MMSEATAQARDLHQANVRLARWLETLAPAAGPPQLLGEVREEQIAGIFSELTRFQELTASRSPVFDTDSERELAQYRQQVERLQTLLPQIHTALLHERSRLESEQSRLRSLGEWAQSSERTL